MKNLHLALTLLFISFLINTDLTYSQSILKSGFDPVEYKALLQITGHQTDTPWTFTYGLPYPEGYKLVYRSDSVGLHNRWDLWIRNDNVGIISIRGTTSQPDSWAENFYAAMVPATGTLLVDTDYVFQYKLAESPRAAVHIGWLTGLAYLAPSIIEKLNTQHANGVKEYIIIGHSQGGALAYLLTSYLHYIDKNRIPEGLKFKTYCSAPPKPGNLFFSYDYDYITRDGWSMRIYNSEDWVPQVPISVQTLEDFSNDNPFREEDSLLVKMNLLEKLIVEYIFGRIRNNLDDARDVLIQYLGKDYHDFSIKKYLPRLYQPEYTDDFYYYPCGVPIVLMSQPGYTEFLETETYIPQLFKNHMPGAYYFLLNKIYFQ